MTKEEKLDDFIRYVSMTDEERAAVIDTGLFNSYISAYILHETDTKGALRLFR